MSPTEAGKRLYRTVGPRCADIEVEPAVLGELRGKPAGTVRITATEQAMRVLLWRRLQPRVPRFPDSNPVECRDSEALQTVGRELVSTHCGPLRAVVNGRHVLPTAAACRRP